MPRSRSLPVNVSCDPEVMELANAHHCLICLLTSEQEVRCSSAMTHLALICPKRQWLKESSFFWEQDTPEQQIRTYAPFAHRFLLQTGLLLIVLRGCHHQDDDLDTLEQKFAMLAAHHTQQQQTAKNVKPLKGTKQSGKVEVSAA